MKTLILVIGFSLFYSCLCFGQPVLTKESEYIWKEELNDWELNNEINWEYENEELVKYTRSFFNFLEGNQIRWRQDSKDYENGLLMQEHVHYIHPIWGYRKITYNYIYEDTFLIETQYLYEEEEDDFSYHSKSLYKYNEYGKLILEENFSIYPDGMEVRNSYTENEYNQYGCLAQTIRSLSSETIKNEYSTYQDCEVAERLVWRRYFDHLEYHIVSLDVYNNEFENNEFIKKVDYFYPRYDMFLSEFLGWEYGGNLVEKFDIDGRIIYEIRHDLIDPIYEKFWKYDENGRVIEQERWDWVSREGFELMNWEKNHFEEERDENGFLVKHRYEKVDNDGDTETTETGIFTFINYCDGSVAERYEDVNLEDYTRNRRIVYEYDHIHCPFEKAEQSLAIFPNPNNGIFQIKGELLQGASTNIQVLNVVGQLIYEVKVPEQSYTYDLDLSHLNNGNYVLFVQSGEYYSREKVTIFK